MKETRHRLRAAASLAAASFSLWMLADAARCQGTGIAVRQHAGVLLNDWRGTMAYFQAEFFVLAENRISLVQHGGDDFRCRITSYNVCYTKLLRRLADQIIKNWEKEK